MIEADVFNYQRGEQLDSAGAMPEAVRPRLAHRIRGLFDGYLHSVSNEASQQMWTIQQMLPEGMLSQTLEAVEPDLRTAMKKRDRNAVLWNLVATGMRCALGVGYFVDSVQNIRDKRRLHGVLTLGLGVGFTASSCTNLLNVGFPDRNRIRDASTQMQRYYSTDVGINAAGGKGEGETESLTNQVDRIVRAISLGDIPSISGAQPR